MSSDAIDCNSSTASPPTVRRRRSTVAVLLGLAVALAVSIVGLAGPASAQHPPGDPGGSVIVQYAQALEKGYVEPGWGGGKIPYSWGGGHQATAHPSVGTCQGSDCSAEHRVGLDCSGFSRYVYRLAYGSDVLGATNAQGQKNELTRDSGPHVGDLVFFGGATSIYHVGVYIGGGNMIDEAHTGTFVRTEKVWADAYGYYHT